MIRSLSGLPRALILAYALGSLAGCGSGAGRDLHIAASGSNAGTNCLGNCANATTFLTAADVRQVLAQAVAQAQALHMVASIAVVDRVGNVLAVLRMPGVLAGGNRVVTIASNPGGPPIDSGLDGLQIPVTASVPGDGLAAIAKAITAAYLSSEGNGFSTRTASQIVQRHFNPGELNQPGGPLFGVQFSQLPCSDFMLRLPDAATAGPKRSPLGLSADPGGFPLYKNGTPVGGVGVISNDFIYGLDRDISDVDHDPDEIIALAGTYGFAVAADKQANRIAIDGKTLRFSDATFQDVAAQARNPPPLTLGVDGSLVAVRGYYDPTAGILMGAAFGQPDSGIRPAAAGDFPGRDAFVFVDGSDTERFVPKAGSAPTSAPLSANEVRTILDQALGVADQARSQIRMPLGSHARVTISVVDATGNILGMVRSRDAPVFGADVSLQKARTATLFSSGDAATFIQALPDAQYLNPDLTPSRNIDLGGYVDNVRALIGPTALADGTAFSDRAGGNLSRPNFPDGIDGNPPGPLSKPSGQWSPFSVGFQLDASFNALVSHLLYVFGSNASDVGKNCVGVPFGAASSSAAPRIANGTQTFPGSVPIFRGNTLVGGIGVSGDGVDQDDMISFLGVYRAGQQLGTINNAPQGIRADILTPDGQRLRFVNCPVSPFNNSDAQHVCIGK